MIDQLKPLIGKLTLFAKDRMGFAHPPRLFLRSDSENSQKMLGKTAHYDPQEKAITLFTHSRHPKDILRSYAHELVHHTQNLRGDLSPEKCGEMSQGYAQENEHMRNMEKEAYLQGNMCFRDFEDTLGDKDIYTIKIAESKFLKENRKVNKQKLTELIRNIVRNKLMEAPNASVSGQPFTGPDGERIEDRASAEAFLNAYADSLRGTGNQRFLDRAQAFIDAEETSNAADAQNRADAAAREKKTADDAAALKKKNPYNNDYKKFTADAKLLNTLAIAIPSDPAGKTKWYADKANSSMIVQMQNILDKLRSQDGSLLTNNFGSGQPDPDLDAMIQPYLKKLAAQGASTPGEPAPAPELPPTGAPDPARGISGVAPSAGDTTTGGDVRDPEATAEPATTTTPAGAGGVSNARVKRRAASQEKLLKRMKPFMMEKISDLQRTLMYLGYLAPTQDDGQPSDDGKYGRQTMNAVIELQKAAGMPRRMRDGVLGNDTIRFIKPKSELFKKLKASEQEAKLTNLPGQTDDAGDLGSLFPDSNYSTGVKEEKLTGTPEAENKLYESRFSKRNNRLFEKLIKKWTK